MSQSRLIALTYFDPGKSVRLTVYADTIILDRGRLFEELDRKTAAPLIPEFRDCVLDALIDRGELRPLEVFSLTQRLDAWVLELRPNDENVVEILERGLECGAITIPGADPDQPDGFENVNNITDYLNTFGVTVANRIWDQFTPLFDPAAEPLSEEVLAVNDNIQQQVGYSLYDAQLAVSEQMRRVLTTSCPKKKRWWRRSKRKSLPAGG